jgi:glycosyltransferase involved in cell wall biosynthesis
VIDGAILSRPPTGTARWVGGITAAMRARSDLSVALALGPSHIRRGGRLHRVPNLLRERWWYEWTLPRIASREHAKAMLLPANLSARQTDTPQVVTMLDVNFLSQPGTYERTFVRYATWAYRRSIRDAARLTTISEFSRAEISRWLDADPDRIDVIYPGLDALPSGPVGQRPHARPYALFAGATERHKNIGLLLDAWRRASPADLDLAVVGQPGRDHGAALAAAARSRGRILVRGRVDAAEMDRWYRYASVFLFPSKVEGFGFPPLEAMQRGTPVASSTGGSLPEVLGEAALYFDPDDPDGVASAVGRIMAEDGLRTTLIELGRRRAAGYTWAAAGDAMAGVLRDAADHAR